MLIMRQTEHIVHRSKFRRARI